MVHIMEPHADYEPDPEFKGRFTSEHESKLQAPLGDLIGQLIEQQVDLPEIDLDLHQGLRRGDSKRRQGHWRWCRHEEDQGRFASSRMAITSDHGERIQDFGGYEHGHTKYYRDSSRPRSRLQTLSPAKTRAWSASRTSIRLSLRTGAHCLTSRVVE